MTRWVGVALVAVFAIAVAGANLADGGWWRDDVGVLGVVIGAVAFTLLGAVPTVGLSTLIGRRVGDGTTAASIRAGLAIGAAIWAGLVAFAAYGFTDLAIGQTAPAGLAAVSFGSALAVLGLCWLVEDALTT